MIINQLAANRREFMKMAAGAALLPHSVPRIGYSAEHISEPPLEDGRDQPFTRGWRFFRGDGDGFEKVEFDDGSWRRIDLPHDWSIEDVPGGPKEGIVGPFDKNAIGGASTGFALGGEGWYRRRFRIDCLSQEGCAEIMFDGVYMVSDVWLNGQSLGTHKYGYTPFALNMTPHIDWKGENVIAVRVRNLGENSRWYSGSGIYRSVTVDVFREPTRIARWGVHAWTRSITDVAEINVTTLVETPDRGLLLRTRLIDRTGQVVADELSPAKQRTNQTLTVASPLLWSPDEPVLYTLDSTLLRGDRLVDRVTEPFGIRIVVFSPETGMTINGKPTKIHGGCVHHSNGIMGAKAFADSEDRRVLLLKARGFNAIRSSHNPTSKAFRQSCDRHGMLLIEEAFDMWHAFNKPQDYSVYFRDQWQGDLDAMVLSARNSPSVIMWSIGNEIPERGTSEGLRWAWRLANEVHRVDPTRPVTAAVHSFLGRSVIASERTARPGHAGEMDETATIFLDVVGYNYKQREIEALHESRPHRIVYGSETLARDVFVYADLERRLPYFMGEFVWTAMDYLGEAGLGVTVSHRIGEQAVMGSAYPWVNSFCGDIDLVGQQKPQSFVRDVAWGISSLEILVRRPLPDGCRADTTSWGWPDELASWTWLGFEGKPLNLRVFTSAERVDLILNGRLVASTNLSAADNMTAEFTVPYESGTIEAVGFRNGAQIGRRVLETAAKPIKLLLRLDRSSTIRERQSLTHVTVEVLDHEGRLVPEAQVNVRLTVDGPAELIAFGSASPFAVGSFSGEATQTWQGRALAILRSTGLEGSVQIEARSSGLESAAATVSMR